MGRFANWRRRRIGRASTNQLIAVARELRADGVHIVATVREGAGLVVRQTETKTQTSETFLLRIDVVGVLLGESPDVKVEGHVMVLTGE